MIEEFELLPVSSSGQSGGATDYILQRRMRTLKIFVSLLKNNALNDEFKLLKPDGSVNDAANIVQLLELTQSKNEKSDGLDDFVKQLVKSNIDLSWIVNTNIKERIRASRETRAKTTTITEASDDDDDDNDDDNDDGDDGSNGDADQIAVNNSQSSLGQSSSTQPKTIMSESYEAMEGNVGKMKSKKKTRKFTPYKSRLSPIIGDERYEEVKRPSFTDKRPNLSNKRQSLKRKASRIAMSTRSRTRKRLRSTTVKWQTL